MTLEKPTYVLKLEEIYGPPSQEAFGTAVFFEVSKNFDMDDAALEKYRYYVGDLWEQYGEEAWTGPWKQVYNRENDHKGDILQELKAIDDFDARMSIPMFLEGIDDPQKANQALQEAFDDPAVSQLAVYNIGDGGAMSGILIAAFRENSAQATYLIFLMD